MDMARRAPRTGHPLVDNLLIVAWTTLFAVNEWVSLSQFADLMVGVGALLTGVLTAMRIWQHLAGETILTSVLTLLDSDEREADT